jgi:uncharacterized protein with PIN domain
VTLVVDSSAIIALLLDEPEASSIEFALAESFPVVISAARLGPQGALAVDQILRHADIELLPL